MINYLEWDSNFLGLKTGMMLNCSERSLKRQLGLAKKQDYKLIYYFSDPKVFLSEHLLRRYNGKIVDCKVLYELHVPSFQCGQFGDTKHYEQHEPSKDLLDLAYESGKYSRFKLDPNFSTRVFEDMYKLWLENSINGRLADWVFYVEYCDRAIGFVTIKRGADLLHIGLVATARDFQGKGYGRQLINRVVEMAKELGLHRIEVPTQKANTQACRFYEACGFRIKTVVNVCHFWI